MNLVDDRTRPIRVVIVEDSPDDAERNIRALRRDGLDIECKCVETADDFHVALERGADIVLADHSLPHFDSLEALRLLRLHDPDTPLVVVTGSLGEEAAVELMRAGANDYVLKDHLERLSPAVRRELGDARMRRERRSAYEALRASEERYRAVFSAAKDGIFMMDGLRLVDCNPSACELLGTTLSALIGRSILDYSPAVQPDGTSSAVRAEALRDAALKGSPQRFEWRYRRPDGEDRDVEVGLSPFWLGERLMLLTAVRDITAQRRAELRVRLQSEALNASADAVYVVGCDGVILDVNKGFERITGYDGAELVGRAYSATFFQASTQCPDIYERIRRVVAAGEVYRGVVSRRRKDGSLYQEELTVTPVVDEQSGGSYYVAVGRDLTEQLELRGRLEWIANYDPLTGLPNRSLMLERASQLLIRARRASAQVAMLVVDLDRFQVVNSSLGHDAGDEVLRAVARRISDSVPATATVARLAADEFGVLMDECCGPHDLVGVIERVHDTLAQTFDALGHEMVLSATIGVSVYPDDADSATELLRSADTALHQAKQTEGERYGFYSVGVQEVALRQLVMEGDLRRAIADEQLHVLYQPKVDLRDSRVCGFEALVRWQHPQHGPISPASFIPIAEETGLIEPLGAYVLRTACRYAAATGHRLPVAVNLSGRQFQSPGLVMLIGEVLDETGLPPWQLQLEITETTFISNVETSSHLVRVLSGMGVELAIDDFGTGYSSLAYLKRFPVHALKIDCSFVQNIVESEDDCAIVRATVAMAHQLRFLVVAEGVETEAQVRLLMGLGCDICQGYLFARPMSGEALTEWLIGNRGRIEGVGGLG